MFWLMAIVAFVLLETIVVKTQILRPFQSLYDLEDLGERLLLSILIISVASITLLLFFVHFEIVEKIKCPNLFESYYFKYYKNIIIPNAIILIYGGMMIKDVLKFKVPIFDYREYKQIKNFNYIELIKKVESIDSSEEKNIEIINAYIEKYNEGVKLVYNIHLNLIIIMLLFFCITVYPIYIVKNVISNGSNYIFLKIGALFVVVLIYLIFILIDFGSYLDKTGHGWNDKNIKGKYYNRSVEEVFEKLKKRKKVSKKPIKIKKIIGKIIKKIREEEFLKVIVIVVSLIGLSYLK